jgi:CelD/BcsL family acetyltransferase involved in cellulose biosynthesis
MIDVALGPAGDLAALERRWRALEARADPSFFQSWTWVGCLAAERFADPVLLEARRDGRTVALALFGRRGRRLHLHETGDSGWDAVFIEHNGLLADPRDDAGTAAACLRALARSALVMSGVGDAMLAALRALPGAVRVLQTRPAPYVAFAALGDAAYPEALSANARYQIRRSDRSYERSGPLRLEAARSLAEAHAFLDALALLHQRSWTARGQPGAFANPRFHRFHHALLDRAFPRGEIELLRIAAGERVLGYLYNFVHRGDVLAYQSGFDLAGAGRHEKPGLTAHRLAIEAHRARGARSYDFLAGAARYKTTLANASRDLHWIAYAPRFSLRWLAQLARAQAQATSPAVLRTDATASRAALAISPLSLATVTKRNPMPIIRAA